MPGLALWAALQRFAQHDKNAWPRLRLRGRTALNLTKLHDGFWDIGLSKMKLGRPFSFPLKFIR